MSLIRYNHSASTTYQSEGKPFKAKYGDGSFVSGTTAVDRVVMSGVGIGNSSFGMVAVDDSTIAKRGVEGVVGLGFGRAANVKGAIIFGGVDRTKYVGNFTWTPITDKNSWRIHFEAVSLGGNDLGLSGDALVDSGTSMIVVPSKVATIFHGFIPGAIEAPQVGWILPCNTSSGDLNFTISGQQFRVPSEELVVLIRIPGYAEYCKSAIDVALPDAES
ncbi:hypothetical protein BGW38_010982, partial [Lunasporangiospora selenospora]